MQAKTVELERLKRENPSPKELEKVETKFRQRKLNIPSKKPHQSYKSKRISPLKVLGHEIEVNFFD